MRLIDFLVKELLQYSRDRRMVFTLFAMPIVQLILFGFALNTDVKHLTVAVCDQDRTAESRDLITEITATDYFDFLGLTPDPKTAGSLLVAGKADLVVVIPPEFERKVKAGDTAAIQALVDGSNPNTGTLAAGYLGAIVQSRGVQVLADRSLRAGQTNVSAAGVDARMRVWYNPALETSYSMVPGVVCTVVGMMSMFLAATAIVKEREDGTIEQLIVTPVKTWELMVGKSLPILVVGYIEILSILLIGVTLFHIPVRGSPLLLLAIACPFLLASLALGLIVSTVSKTQQQAAMTMAFFAMPNMLLSGFMFPISSMPVFLQKATAVIPMRYYLVVTRDILLKGSGIGLLWDQVLPLIALSAAFLAFAAWRFQKKLD